MFISGLVMVIGLKKTGSFFTRPRKWRGSIAFVAGVILVLIKMPMIGMIVELFGIINLFGYQYVFDYVTAFWQRLFSSFGEFFEKVARNWTNFKHPSHIRRTILISMLSLYNMYEQTIDRITGSTSKLPV